MPIDFGISSAVAQDLVATLTRREAQVAEGMAMGEERRAIAQRLGISIRTFDIFLGNVREKLGVTSHGIARVLFAAMT